MVNIKNKETIILDRMLNGQRFMLTDGNTYCMKNYKIYRVVYNTDSPLRTMYNEIAYVEETKMTLSKFLKLCSCYTYEELTKTSIY